MHTGALWSGPHVARVPSVKERKERCSSRGRGPVQETPVLPPNAGEENSSSRRFVADPGPFDRRPAVS
jgi:hypothetical protein